MELFAGFVEHTDTEIGRLIDGIDERGLKDNTLIIYIFGDNGSSAEGQQGSISELLAQNNISNTVEQQIEDSVNDAVAAARTRLPAGEGETHCIECGEEIPDARRRALPGARTCIACQAERDRSVVHSAINRRGSKDSQLR